MTGRAPRTLALVGVGPWGTVLLRNLIAHPEVERLVVCDERPERAERARRDHPTVAFKPRLDDVLGDPQVEAVVLATPIPTHARLGMAVLEAGKHLLVEKPMATEGAEAKTMVELAETRSLVLMVGHTAQYTAGAAEIRSRVRTPAFGLPIRVQATRLNEGAPRASALWDLAVHDLAVALEWLDGPPEQVRALDMTDAPERVRVELHIGGCLVTLDVGRGPRTRQMHVVGSADELVWTHDARGERLYRGAARRSMPLSPIPPLKRQLDEFLKSLRQGVPPRSNGRHGLRVVEVVAKIEAALSAPPEPRTELNLRDQRLQAGHRTEPARRKKKPRGRNPSSGRA